MLPLKRTAHDDVVAALADFGRIKGLSPEDLALVLQEGLEAWELSGNVGDVLRDALNVALRSTPDVLERVDGPAYLRMYTRLRTRSGDVAGLTHSLARDLLSRSALIAHLLKEERLSCSQIARLLASTDTKLDVSYGSIAVVARELGMLPELPRGSGYEDLWNRDRDLSLHLFPDSSVEETNQIAAEAVEAWVQEVDVLNLLGCLNPFQSEAAEPSWPYLQILHWCLTPLEYFDHPASYLYEFKPRGQAGETLFRNYPAVTGNPVLNNAKAVETLNQTWSRNRGGEDAHALVALLGALEAIPAVPRREAARVVRAWLWRVIELRTIEPNLLESTPTQAGIDLVTNFITAHETNTQGVIEQRVVDYLSYLSFGWPGWRPRGLGDGVNASNFSRHKLGDVEFTNVDERSAIALEAHGGHLSATYVRSHQKSLARIVDQRLEESWANLDDPSNWNIRVIFVAHSRSTDLPLFDVLHGVPVTYEYLNYAQLIDMANAESAEHDRIAAFEVHVLDAMNRRTVRESARQRFREILSGEYP